jgi:hypothetical protein
MTDIVRQKPFSLAPTTFAEAERFAKLVASSSFAPKGYAGKPGDVLVAMQMGAELGLSPMQALQNIAVVNGRPSVWGDAILAICMAHPAFESIHEEVANGVATCAVVRKGMPPVVRKFSVDDAKRAGLWGKAGPWTQYPDRMLQMRPRGFACRDAFPDALRGLISREEAEDIPRETVRAEVVTRHVAELDGFDRPSGRAHTVGDAIGLKRPVDPIHEAIREEMSKPHEERAITQTDPESYVIRARGKNEGKRLGELGSDALSWYAQNSRDAELKRYAQSALELRIEREAGANQAELETLAGNDAWGMSGVDAREMDGHDEMGKP